MNLFNKKKDLDVLDKKLKALALMSVIVCAIATIVCRTFAFMMVSVIIIVIVSLVTEKEL